MERRDIRNTPVTFGTTGNQHSGKAVLRPALARLAAKVAFQTAGAALHFVLLNRQIDFRRSGVAEHQIEFYRERFFDQPREVVSDCAQGGGAATRPLGRAAHVVDGFEWRVAADVNNPLSL